MAQLISIKLASKHNKSTGIYVYTGICVEDGVYYYALLPKSSYPLTLARAQELDWVKGRKIEPEFYKANGINV